MSKKEPQKTPPKQTEQSFQHYLFSQFVTNDKRALSNSLEIWESIPKYFLSPFQIVRLRTKDGLAKPYELSYTFNDTAFSVRIQPALIKQKDGEYKAFFPGETEELIEEALKKILADQNFCIHDPEKHETWVKFSLSMLERELKARSKTRSLTQIKHALEIMAGSIITLYKNDQEVWTGSILQDLFTIDRQKYLNETDALHTAKFPLFISHSIDKLEYRQFNFERLMSCSEQLTRWLYKKLINRYKQASAENTYHINFSTIQIESGFLQQSRIRDNRRKVINALDELIHNQILTNYKTKEHKKGKKIVDITYMFTPSASFIKEQKASNKRTKLALEKLNPTGIIITIPPPKPPKKPPSKW